MADIDLTGQVAIVSGASRGVGRTYAMALAAAGAKVMALARTLDGHSEVPGSLAEVAGTARESGFTIEVCYCDVLDPASIVGAITTTLDRFGRLDILVNNAVWSINKTPFLQISDEEWHGVLLANVRAPYRFLREAVPHMIAAGGGSIINVTSAAAQTTARDTIAHGFPAYAISKAALDRLTTYAAAELAGSNIAVNAVSPGNVAYYTRDGAHPHGGFWGEPMVFLASQRPASGGSTGAILHTYQYGRSWGPLLRPPTEWDEDVRHILAEAGLA